MAAVAFTSIDRGSDGKWIFQWTVSGNYDVYFMGSLLDQIIGSNSYSCNILPDLDDPPPIEIVPSGTLPGSFYDSPTVSLQWMAVSGAYFYTIERYVSGVWNPEDTVDATLQPFIVTYHSVSFPDNTTQQFRVVTYNQFREGSSPTTITKKIVCNPTFGMNANKILVQYNNPNIEISEEV